MLTNSIKTSDKIHNKWLKTLRKKEVEIYGLNPYVKDKKTDAIDVEKIFFTIIHTELPRRKAAAQVF